MAPDGNTPAAQRFQAAYSDLSFGDPRRHDFVRGAPGRWQEALFARLRDLNRQRFNVPDHIRAPRERVPTDRAFDREREPASRGHSHRRANPLLADRDYSG